MAGEQKKCPACSGELEEGFIFDKSSALVLVQRWIKGSPESSIWQGTKTSDKECRSVESWRCVQCGLLKSYAIKEVEPPEFFHQ
ncbi:MAG TPA: PF20097 family protein [Pyrinomonadaceae bacterium]|jgi:hypothetical protein